MQLPLQQVLVGNASTSTDAINHNHLNIQYFSYYRSDFAGSNW